MASFTKPHSKRSVALPVAGAQETGSPATLNKNIGSKSTPPPSPVKQFSPSTPKSTALYRHFLQQVKMSPATPPRTPTRKKHDSPAKERDSPTKVRESPTKQHLEIGQNSFYFSCELPISKVTPKKASTPSKPYSPKKNDASTPAKKIPSPLKMHAESVAPASEPTIDASNKPLRQSLSSEPSNIGHLMAGLRNADTTKPNDPALVASVGEPNASPAPTPLRRASDKLRLLAPESFYTAAEVCANGNSFSLPKDDASSITSAQKLSAAQEISIAASTQASRAKLSTAKQADTSNKNRNTTSVHSRLMSSTATKLSKSTAAAGNTTPHELTKRLGDANSSSIGVCGSTPHRKAPIALGKSFSGSSIPRSVRKPVFDTSASTKTAAKSPLSTRRPLDTTPQVKTTKKSAVSAALRPYVNTADPHPSEQNVASAADIAAKVAEWNKEDREKAAVASPVAKTLTKTPLKGNKIVGSKLKGESFTPEGSPSKPASPIKHPKLRSIQLSPDLSSPALKTPTDKKTVATRMRDRGALRTPADNKIGKFDRNALRTPSKAIESSLDKAIDAQIAEDARSGREFTPGGNRVQDLLEAKKREIS